MWHVFKYTDCILTSFLITPVTTVHITITVPIAWNALSTITLPLIIPARATCTMKQQSIYMCETQTGNYLVVSKDQTHTYSTHTHTCVRKCWNVDQPCELTVKTPFVYTVEEMHSSCKHALFLGIDHRHIFNNYIIYASSYLIWTEVQISYNMVWACTTCIYTCVYTYMDTMSSLRGS